MLERGVGEGLGAFAWAGLVLVCSLGLKATISRKISKRWVCNGCVYRISWRDQWARAFLSTVSSLYVGSRLGDSVREPVSVVMCLELSWSFRSTRVLLAGRSGQQPAPSPCRSASIVRPRGLFCLCLSAVVLMQFVLSYCSHFCLFYFLFLVGGV